MATAVLHLGSSVCVCVSVCRLHESSYQTGTWMCRLSLYYHTESGEPTARHTHSSDGHNFLKFTHTTCSSSLLTNNKQVLTNNNKFE